MAHARVVKGGWYWNGGRKQRAGDVVEASPAQIAAWEKDGYVEAVGRTAPERAEAPKPEQAVALSEPEPPARDWPHKIKPAQYINRFPDGPDADFARSLLGENKG